MTKKTSDNIIPTKGKARKSRGCLIVLLIVVIILAVGAIIIFRVPEKIGLVKSPAEKLYTQPNDAEKAAIVMESFQAAGLNTQGVEVYVMPVAGTDHNTALIVLDASKGFSFNSSGITDPIDDFIAVAVQAQQQGINRAAVTYYDEKGKELLTVTVPTGDVVAYSQGGLTDRQLMENVDIGAGSLIGLINEFRTQFK
ncbi:MAG: hypothetical protein A2Y90_03605 [Chloroflexi bacterium RBG_13_52_12]|nr:MAG: hypothetical protein A2Y90_03605 [Chloroflexi bacterium RBG_13_52_12]